MVLVSGRVLNGGSVSCHTGTAAVVCGSSGGRACCCGFSGLVTLGHLLGRGPVVAPGAALFKVAAVLLPLLLHAQVDLEVVLDELVRAERELQEELQAHVDHHEGHAEVHVGEDVRGLHRLQVRDGEVGDVREQSAENQPAPPVAGAPDRHADRKHHHGLREHHEVPDHHDRGDLVDQRVVDVGHDLLECQARNEHLDGDRADVLGGVHREDVFSGKIEPDPDDQIDLEDRLDRNVNELSERSACHCWCWR